MEFDQLVQLPESARDEAWERRFLDAILQMRVDVLNNGETVRGPDGWPYLSVKTGGEGEEEFSKVVRWLAGRGIGLVVNSFKMVPDYVFTYGMIWNFVETGRFITPWEVPLPGEVHLAPESRPLIGPPTEKYLPSYVRSILRELLGQQGFSKPLILVATTGDFKVQDLLLARESVGSLSATEQRDLAEALSWFLPLHYSLVFVDKKEFSGWIEL
ncbi:MAG: hypothetical protein AB7F86_00930 [Bdellovibrionales bacterium]